MRAASQTEGHFAQMGGKKRPSARAILVVRYRFIGDTILTVPFLRNLRAAYPQARIDVLVGPKSGEVLQGLPYVDNLIVYDTTRFHKYDSGKGKTRCFLSYVFELGKNKYDTVFLLKRSFSSAALAFLIGAKRRIGYGTEGRNFLLTDPVVWRKDIHEVESLLSVLQAVDIPVDDGRLEAFVSPTEVAEVLALEPRLNEERPRVLIHAAAAHPDKLYPLESWAILVKRLRDELGLEPVFSGDAQDRSTYESLAQLCALEKPINMAGKLSLRQSMALYSRMQLAVCVDSGPAHLASAVGVPTVALFGPTDPVRWAPYGPRHLAVYDESLACRPCHYQKTCQDRECLTRLNPDFVFEKCLNVYAGSPRREGCNLI
ncbi:MAG: glycosyltransferase family 9 protein [Cyanobacteria bacterium REEB67]|nr:glycosyltransferase family 9 protein [Cyanobacteria bacterium REEB67]